MTNFLRFRSLLLLMCLPALFFMGCGGFKGVVTPTLTSISTTTIAAGSPAFTLTATGTNFTKGTKIVWDGVAQATTVVSNTQLTTAVSAAQVAAPGTVNIGVVKADTTSSGNVIQLTITGGGIKLSSISPSTAAAGGASFTLTATGTGFANGSVITWNGVPATTTFDSPTQLHTTVTAAQIAQPATVNVGVLSATNTLSNQLPFTITGTAPGGSGTPPALVTLSPATIVAGSASFTLTANGTGFAAGSKIVWDGVAQATTFVSSTQLTTPITAAQVAVADSITVAVVNPDSTISNFLTFLISANPAVSPTLTSVTPNTFAVVPAGSPDVTITLLGSNFDSAAIVQSTNAGVITSLKTTFISPTQLTAVFPATNLVDIGQFQITVLNPGPRNSNPLPINVGIVTYAGQVRDVVWDPTRQLFYVSVPNESTKAPNTITAVTPLGKATPYAVPGDPDRLALSGDGKYLYVGLDSKGSVARYVLPLTTTSAPDITASLGSDPNQGPFYALDLQVAPGAPTTIAVSRGISSKTAIIQAQGGVAIYDFANGAGTPRPSDVTPTANPGVKLDTLQWGADATALYAANNEDQGGNFYQMSVSAAGVTLVSDHPNYFPPPDIRIHFDTGLLYGDDGQVVDPKLATQVKSFVAGGIMVPDSGLGIAYFLGQPTSQLGTVSYLLESFNLATTTRIGSIPLYNIAGTPQHLIRWGTSGLAFSTARIVNPVTKNTVSSGSLYILSGPFVTTP